MELGWVQIAHFHYLLPNAMSMKEQIPQRLILITFSVLVTKDSLQPQIPVQKLSYSRLCQLAEGVNLHGLSQSSSLF